jgi:hypothetical protein
MQGWVAWSVDEASMVCINNYRKPRAIYRDKRYVRRLNDTQSFQLQRIDSRSTHCVLALKRRKAMIAVDVLDRDQSPRLSAVKDGP